MHLASPSKAISHTGPLRDWPRLLPAGAATNHARLSAWTGSLTGAERGQASRYIQEPNNHPAGTVNERPERCGQRNRTVLNQSTASSFRFRFRLTEDVN